MGVVSQERHFGGSRTVAFASDITLGYSLDQRVVLLNPNSGSGHTVTLKAADSPEIPYGAKVIVGINIDPSLSFTLEDDEATISETIAAGKAFYVHKATNSGGSPRFYVDVRDLL